MIYGFIGTGNMGSILAKVISTGNNTLLLANRTFSKAEKLAKSLGGQALSNIEVAKRSDVIFLCVKPQMIADVFDEIREVLIARNERIILVSIVAGYSMDDIIALSGIKDCPILKLVPNTPIAIGEGIVLYDYKNLDDSEADVVISSLASCGMIEYLPEKLMRPAGTIAGCGPAFVDLFIEALADGGVLCGLPRAKAYALASKMVMGSAAYALASNKHPGQLKDEVTSPGGTTIRGIRALEKGGFRSSVMEAVIAASEKTSQLK